MVVVNISREPGDAGGGSGGAGVFANAVPDVTQRGEAFHGGHALTSQTGAILYALDEKTESGHGLSSVAWGTDRQGAVANNPRFETGWICHSRRAGRASTTETPPRPSRGPWISRYGGESFCCFL
ncbi:putative 14.4 kDa protein [Human mastadenovirus F]|uniref:Putative 14.4 kDa protein n=1 Tax=Human mastadenovirus F TaxID=130309 RepID=A0A7U3RXX2_9ADEN|nr:putative 14.4 kDa protein [Human mastadenovirus F]